MTGPNLKAGMMTHSGAMVGMHFGVPTMADIALALSRIPRFGGHCRVPWTVLSHSLVCERIAQKENRSRGVRLWALLHDAHEALTGDVPSPLKVPQMKVLQQVLDGRIEVEYFPDYLGTIVKPTIDEIVHEIDYRALVAEAVTVGPPYLGEHNVVELFGAEPRRDDVAVVNAQLHMAGLYDEAHGCFLEDQRAYFLHRYEDLTN